MHIFERGKKLCFNIRCETFRGTGHVRHDSGGVAKPDAGHNPSAPTSPRSQGKDKVKRNLKDQMAVRIH